MVPERMAQTLDGDGKPTIRNLAEALETLTHLGCDLDVGRIWFEVISEASSPAVSASLFYSREQGSVDVRLVLPLLRGVKGWTEFGAPLRLSLEALHLAADSGASRPQFRNDVAHPFRDYSARHSEMMSPTIPG